MPWRIAQPRAHSDDAPGREPRVAAVVLAAGMSRRMLGPAKCLLPFGGRPMIRHIVERLVDVSELHTRLVVTGHYRSGVSAALFHDEPPLDVQLVHNRDYEAGEMLSSVQTGLRAMRDSCDAAIIFLGDQPTFAAGTVRSLIAAWSDTNPRPRVVLPSYGGKRGHPILLDATGIDEILALPAGATLKDYTSRYVRQTIDVPVNDATILDDIDTPQDYDRAVRWWRELGNLAAEPPALQTPPQLRSIKLQEHPPCPS
jgi:molybdenum cofactor cytidylyltransferase